MPGDVTMSDLSWALIRHWTLSSSLIGQDLEDVMSLSRAGKCHQNMKLESLVTENSREADIRYSIYSTELLIGRIEQHNKILKRS